MGPSAAAPSAPAQSQAIAGLEELRARYGFSSAAPSPAMLASPEAAREAVASAGAAIESLAMILSKGGSVPLERARALCGLGGAVALRFSSPASMGGASASFSPKQGAITLADREAGGARAGAHFGHEWAHALDHALGSKIPGGAPSGAELAQGALARMAEEANLSPAPYQAALGALARDLARGQRADAGYASVKLSSRRAAPPASMPSFAKLVESMLPSPAAALGASRRKARQKEASAQAAKLIEFAAEAAYQCLAELPPLGPAPLAERQLRSLASFCARAVLSRSSQEGAARRGRERAIDAAKSDIATMLSRSLRISAEEAASAASSIFHIAPIKKLLGDDPFYSAPYTGRSTWEASPASLADLSCALVRICRNQRALANRSLSKERFVPMAFWWSMRRQVSVCAEGIDAQASGIIAHLADAGMVDRAFAEHAELWRSERGAYKAGALVFSDLVGTGSKMIRIEAGQAGRDIGPSEARGLRRRIAAPINELAQRKTVLESLAESFEQFVVSQSASPTPLGRACKSALAAHLVDCDEGERGAAMDPSVSWMSCKDGDVEGNQRRWRAVLRELPSLFPEAPAPSPRARRTFA